MNGYCNEEIYLEDLGSPYLILSETEMHKISDDVLDCAVYLYPTRADAERGERIGGSGFLLFMTSERVNDLHFTYVVTNSHVVREGQARVIRQNLRSGGFLSISSSERSWTHHETDDLAVAEIAVHPDVHKSSLIRYDYLVTKQTIEDYDIGVG